MSYEAMHKVRASGLSDRTQVDVLEALAFFQNPETGACYPSTRLNRPKENSPTSSKIDS